MSDEGESILVEGLPPPVWRRALILLARVGIAVRFPGSHHLLWYGVLGCWIGFEPFTLTVNEDGTSDLKSEAING
ncbi:hypothetical protein TSA6c_00025 [Azospirillum sp. TSA6c]|uniref:hypothetical protein n=1 Tax=Azospirillum sp. TSA6c TaxID=709813 RepID=UPI000D6155C2|nr:hypothetical protein [Azospirillum sp. TSA6c]PWC54668.1 hypothetical protein TSA6c_00025 [Azospirillum sp. TSA6c]